MNKKMVGWNALASVVFVLLLITHLIMLRNMQDWYYKYETFWPMIDFMLVRPLLAFTTGYVLLSSIFALLKAKLEIEGLRRWNILRIVMFVISLLVVAMMILGLLWLFGLGEFVTPSLWKFIYDVCHAQWLWLILGIYWFLSLNALRVTGFEPLDGDFDRE